MKKILTLMCCTILLAATSCTKKYVTPGTTNRTVFYTIKGGLVTNNGGWSLFTDAGSGTQSYQSTLGSSTDPLPELDAYTQANGAVLVYLSPDNGANYEQVPETYSGTAFSFTHSKNQITIYAQSADGKAAILPTYDVLIKIVLVDSTPQ